MQLPDNLTPEQSDAIVKCLRQFAAHGRAIRLREQAEQKTESPSNLAGAGDSGGANGTNILVEVCPDAP